jgi:ESS family glutamate:Na+ symporter
MQFTPDNAITLAAAISTIAFGMGVNRVLPVLERANIPPAVTGGLIVAIVLEALQQLGGVEVTFATELRGLLLLVFFASLGLAARFRLLKTGGPAVAWVCVIIVLTIAAQNAIGIAVAQAYGLDPRLGLFMGSIAYLGGHGTTAAWAQAAEVADVPDAFELGIASATLGLVVGGLVGGPVAGWLAGRAAARPEPGGEASLPAVPQTPTATAHAAADRIDAPESSDRWVLSLLVLAACLVLGELFGRLATASGYPLPAFLTALLAGVLLTNFGDALGRAVDLPRADLIGTLALRVFLAMSMLSLDFSTLASYVAPLATALAAQVAATSLIATLLLYRVLGRGHEGGVGAGGFIGFALGAMPVGIATMKRVVQRVGPAPRAFVVVTLAAALFQDTANAVLVRVFFSLL